jgi:hypothetical protein
MRISTPKIEGALQVSKWIKCPVLLDIEEMRELLEVLAPSSLFAVSAPVPSGQESLSAPQFLSLYAQYVEALRQGQTPDSALFRAPFSSALSRTADPFYAMNLSSEMRLIKPVQPVIQLQAHHFFYSSLDRKFHSMVLGAESISWGIQFSYPQLFQDPHTRRVVSVKERFENTELFAALRRYLRSATLPTPFLVDGQRTNSPMRIGKRAMLWAREHPQLKSRGIQLAH